MSSQSILVVGGGFSGISAALEAAEVGHEVYLVEKTAYLGGRVAQLNKYFPKICPPSCGLEIQFQRIKNNPRIKVFTMAEVVGVSGSAGNFKVKVRLSPRYVGPGSVDLRPLAASLAKDVPDEFNFGLGTRKPLHMDMPFAFPPRYVLDKDACSQEELKQLDAGPVIDLTDKERELELDVGSIILATGWKPYDVTRLTNLGAGQVANCVSNMQFERLASAFGPTGGHIVRPSDGQAPKSIAFVQCAGSRDENHLNYCSYICCMASLKQALYVREQYPDARITIFYIDLRTPGRYDNFAKRVLADPKIRAVKGKVAAARADASDRVVLTVENAVTGIKSEEVFDLAVLATGMQPSLAGQPNPYGVALDEMGYVIGGADKGIFAAGCAKVPLDVMKSAQSATGAALKAIQTVTGR